MPEREAQTLYVERNLERLPRPLRRLFDRSGLLSAGFLPDMALEIWRGHAQPELRVSQEVALWLECRRRETEGLALRRSYEQNVQSGVWPAQETLLPLFPYQREGMLHLVLRGAGPARRRDGTGQDGAGGGGQRRCCGGWAGPSACWWSHHPRLQGEWEEGIDPPIHAAAVAGASTGRVLERLRRLRA